MKRNKYKDYLWYTAIAVFVICVLEGIFYYHSVESPFLKVMLNIQNAIKAYKIDPDIDQADALEYVKTAGGGVFTIILTYVYCIAVIIAPLCTVGALAILVRKPASYVRSLLSQRGKKRILLIGEGAYKKQFISGLAKECRITTIETGAMTEEAKLKYMNKGVNYRQKYDDMSIEDILKTIDITKYADIILCDDNAMENIEYLKVIGSICNSLQKPSGDNASYKQIYLSCSDNSMSQLIKQYYDRLEEKNFDLNIIDVNRMAVNKMFKEHPVYQVNTGDDYDVHLGIIGFGEFGQSTLIQGINMAVLTAESDICIDVFDKDMKSIIGSFMKNFNVDALDGLKLVAEDVFIGEKAEYYELNFPFEENNDRFGIDGHIKIRFWETDATTLQFNKIFKKCNADKPFTYLVVAMGDTHSMANTIIELKQLLYKKGDKCINIPVVIRMKDSNNISKIYDEKNLFTIEQNRDIFSYESLTDHYIVDEAKMFNHRYNVLYDVINEYKKQGKVLNDEFMLKIEDVLSEEALSVESSQAKLNAAWHKMSIFDRESSIAQSLHQDIKKWLVCDKKAYTFSDKEELERIEHRRWNIFMITHGFKYEKADRKDLYARTHPCISKWEVLKVEKPDTLEYDFTPYYILRHTQNK